MIEQVKLATKLPDLTSLFEAVKTAFCITICELTPFFLLILVIVGIRALIKRCIKNRKVKSKEKRKVIKFKTDEKMMKQLKGHLEVSAKPESLYLIFDENGYIIEVLNI